MFKLKLYCLTFLLFLSSSFCFAESLAGNWHGTADYGGKCHFVVVIQKSATGKFEATYDDIERGDFGKAFDHVRVKGKSFQAEFEGDGRINLVLKGLHRLVGTIKIPVLFPQVAGKTLSLELSPGMDYSIPRVDAQGKPVTEYHYQAPSPMGDGMETASLAETGGNPASLGAMVNAVLMGTFPNTHSILLLRHGKLVLEEYFYGYGPGDEHQMQSTSKSILSILFGIAQDQDLVTIGKKLFDYFPDYRVQAGWDDRKNRITLGTLLSMTSGFDCDDGTYRKEGGSGCTIDMLNSPHWLDFCLSKPMAHEPGRHYAYCTSCLSILSAVLAKRSGMPLPNFAQKYLYDPLDIPAPTWLTGPDGTTEAGSTFWLRPRDMAKLGLLYLDNGKWKGSTVVSSKWVEESTRPQPIPADGKPWPTFEGYGYLWWTRHLHSAKGETFVYYANGKGGQYIIVVPSLDLVCVMTAGYYRNVSSDQGLELFKQFVLDSFS